MTFFGFSGVLDIAGGKGAIAFRLQVEEGIKATVIDPLLRRSTLALRERKKLRKRGRCAPEHVAASFSADWGSPFCQTYSSLLNEASCLIAMHPVKFLRKEVS